MILKLGRAAWRAGTVECVRLFRAKSFSVPGDGVAIVRPDLLGDFVLASGFLPLFRQVWPDRPLALAGNAAWGDLALWLDRHRIVSAELLFDDFIPLRPEALGWRAPTRGAPTYARALETLAPWGTLVYFASSRTHAIDRLLGDAPGAVVACEGDNANQPAFLNRRNLRRYDTVLPGCADGIELARNACFINTLAGSELAKPDPPRWHIPEYLRRQTVAELVRRTGWSGSDMPYVCLSPYASSTLKEWPAAFWKALAGELRRLQPDLTLVTLGAPRDRNRPVPEGCVNLVGTTSLPELACVLAGACVSVSGDTAAAHLAAAVGTSTVAVVGGGHRDRFFPYSAAHAGCVNHALRLDLPCDGCGWSCRYRPFGGRPAPCMERISVERVLGEVLALVC
jgi:ADP-heptose:LPS heptosyltransferase